LRIIIFSDSLARPRPEMKCDSTEYADTYGFKLKKAFPEHDIDIIYIDSLDTIDALYWNERMVAFRKPDLVFYHLGVNDCAPRIFKKNSRSILLNTTFQKLTGNFFMKLIKVYRRYLVKTLCRNKVYVGVNEFNKNISKMRRDVLKYSDKCDFYYLSIARQPQWLDKKSPGFNLNTSEYNTIIREVYGDKVIDVDSYLGMSPESYLIHDGIHLTKYSHSVLFDVLKEKVELHQALNV